MIASRDQETKGLVLERIARCLERQKYEDSLFPSEYIYRHPKSTVVGPWDNLAVSNTARTASLHKVYRNLAKEIYTLRHEQVLGTKMHDNITSSCPTFRRREFQHDCDQLDGYESPSADIRDDDDSTVENTTVLMLEFDEPPADPPNQLDRLAPADPQRIIDQRSCVVTACPGVLTVYPDARSFV